MPGPARKIALIGTPVVVAAMCLFPPWKEWRILRNSPYADVTELACYAPFNGPPPSEGPGHGYNINGSLLVIQILLAGLVGASVAFGRKGVIAFTLPVGGFFIGGYIAVAMFFPNRPEGGWVFPIHMIILALFALAGALAGAFAAVLIIKLRGRRASFVSSSRRAR